MPFLATTIVVFAIIIIMTKSIEFIVIAVAPATEKSATTIARDWVITMLSWQLLKLA